MKFVVRPSRHTHPALAAMILLLILLLSALPASAGSIDDDHFEAYFKAKFGYQDIGEFQFKPTILNYVCFSHYISRDFGVLDNDEYVLYGGVSQQEISDYITYLGRFGYRVAFDSVQTDARYVELRNINAPAYMSQVYRFYYYPADEALVTIEPRQTEDAFDAACKLHWENYESEENNTIKLLQPGLTVSLEKVREVNEYTWADAAHPFSSLAFPGLVNDWLGPQRLEKTLEDGTRMLVMNNEYADANGNRTSFWFLQLDFTTAGQQFNPDDWEFCIADDGLCVYYPFHIGNQLIEAEDGLTLCMDPTLFTGNTYTLWLSFPAYFNNPDLFSRLYISRAGEGTPIMERVSFGFDKPGDTEQEVQWDSWDFSPIESPTP